MQCTIHKLMNCKDTSLSTTAQSWRESKPFTFLQEQPLSPIARFLIQMLTTWSTSRFTSRHFWRGKNEVGCRGHLCDGSEQRFMWAQLFNLDLKQPGSAWIILSWASSCDKQKHLTWMNVWEVQFPSQTLKNNAVLEELHVESPPGRCYFINIHISVTFSTLCNLNRNVQLFGSANISS